jgi:CHAT domain-containing protein/lipopolysaccharide biosynthesis regulator YciM
MKCLYQVFRRPRWLSILFVSSLIACLWLGQFSSSLLGIGQVATAQSSPAHQLVEQGVQQYQKEDYRGAINSWEEALKQYQDTDSSSNQAIVLENLARAYGKIGQTETAIARFEQAITHYRQLRNIQKVGQLLTEQAQGYSQLGQHRNAIALLCTEGEINDLESDCRPESAILIARQQSDVLGEAVALGSLGKAYRLRGKYDQAIEYLETARNLPEANYQEAIFNSLGNAHFSRAKLWNLRATTSAQQLGDIRQETQFENRAIVNYQEAFDYFQSSLDLARKQDNPSAQARSLLNLIQLSYHSHNLNIIEPAQADKMIAQALALSKKLPDSSSKVYALVELATLPEFSADVISPLTGCSQQKLANAETKRLLNQAINLAQSLQDFRAQSFAEGALGHFYECQGDDKQALNFTQKAVLSAEQNLKALDSLYLWEWQTGRILKAQGKEIDAVAAYDRALTSLDNIRDEILTAQRDIQFDFRDIIEPLYRQLAQLRLELLSGYPAVEPKQQNQQLTAAIKTVDSLQLAELQNYFGDDCILTAISEENVNNSLPTGTAVFSSLLLDDRIAILLSLPGGEKKFEWIPQSREAVLNEIFKFRQGLLRKRDRVYDTTEAERLYNWIIKPFEEDLQQDKIKNLVFIQDGILRTIPMSALYDTEQFLIEKYAIAVTPSLSLTSQSPTNIQQKQALVLGVTQPVQVDEQEFPALPNVPFEIEEVQALFSQGKLLVDEEFTPNSLEQQLEQTVYPIIHIATHAQFGTIPEDTFIITGNSNKLTINQLETALRQVHNDSQAVEVEILALTACETALGDERAALGLAGVAVQAGAKSALASLWQVSDESTSLLSTQFYDNLVNSGMSKAEALQTAQKQLIAAFENDDINDSFSHPYYWSGFILIGDWL